MKRSFQEYLHFFINEDSEFGEVARMVESDSDFPPEDAAIEIICGHMLKSPLYRNIQLACRNLCDRYQGIE